MVERGFGAAQIRLWRGLSIAVAALLLVLALRAYLGRYERLFQDNTIFAGVSYTDAHITLPGTLVVCVALLIGRGDALRIARSRRPGRAGCWPSAAPAVAAYLIVGLVGGYVSSFIVKPNQLVRERPFIEHNIEMTRRAYALDRIEPHAFPAETDGGCARRGHTIRPRSTTSGCGTGTRCRTRCGRSRRSAPTTIFPTSTSIATRSAAPVRQMMLATRELNVDKLPESSRNWINEKLIYTHGYGVTMNPVNGFTPEGLPTLVLSNMPIQSTLPELKVTRPEIYFGELTNTDVYVKTRQQEFNYPQGDSNNLTSYEGTGGIRLGGLLRRTLIAYDRGDITKLPFSDDVSADSRLLMRRNLRERVAELAPFLTLDPDPYVVVGDDGRIYWLMDAFTTSDSYPYARRYRLADEPINYIRNSVKVVIDAYTGATTFYVFDAQDPVIAAYRRVFPSLFADAAAMPPVLRAARALSGTAAAGAGGGVRPLSHDRSGRVLQPRGSVDRGHRDRHTPSSANR